MELREVIHRWEQLGHIIVSWNTEEARWTLFIKDNDVAGCVRTIGNNHRWHLPEELVAKRVRVEDFRALFKGE